MDLDITQQTLESVLYVATSSHVEVYESLVPSIERAKDSCEASFLSTAGIDAMATDSRLTHLVTQYVCIDAFLTTFRQLDLVLTPTGFGVVQNNKEAPASKQRVDALEQQLLVERKRTEGNLLKHLTSIEGWGATPMAARNIRFPLYRIQQLERLADRTIRIDDWQKAQKGIMEADVELRKRISSELMDNILGKIRTASSETKWWDLIRLIEDYILLFLYNSPSKSECLRNIINHVEADPATFNSYFESTAYKLNHHEPFKNSKDKAAFFFVG